MTSLRTDLHVGNNHVCFIVNVYDILKKTNYFGTETLPLYQKIVASMVAGSIGAVCSLMSVQLISFVLLDCRHTSGCSNGEDAS